MSAYTPSKSKSRRGKKEDESYSDNSMPPTILRSPTTFAENKPSAIPIITKNYGSKVGAVEDFEPYGSLNDNQQPRVPSPETQEMRGTFSENKTPNLYIGRQVSPIESNSTTRRDIRPKKHRAKSAERQPLSSTLSPIRIGSRTPEFFPPSHYAAAAGLLNESNHAHTADSDAVGLEASPQKMETSRAALSVSAAQVVKRRRTLSRSPKASKEKENNFQKFVGRTSLSRRASLLGLPELEKDLLPSLNDTVHRMTLKPRPIVEFDQKVTTLPPTTSDLSVAFTNRHLEPLLSTVTGLPSGGHFICAFKDSEDSNRYVVNNNAFPLTADSEAYRIRSGMKNRVPEKVFERESTDLSDALLHDNMSLRPGITRRRRSRTAESSFVPKSLQSTSPTRVAKSDVRHSFLADPLNIDSISIECPMPVLEQDQLHSKSLRTPKFSKSSRLPQPSPKRKRSKSASKNLRPGSPVSPDSDSTINEDLKQSSFNKLNLHKRGRPGVDTKKEESISFRARSPQDSRRQAINRLVVDLGLADSTEVQDGEEGLSTISDSSRFPDRVLLRVGRRFTKTDDNTRIGSNSASPVLSAQTMSMVYDEQGRSDSDCNIWHAKESTKCRANGRDRGRNSYSNKYASDSPCLIKDQGNAEHGTTSSGSAILLKPKPDKQSLVQRAMDSSRSNTRDGVASNADWPRRAFDTSPFVPQVDVNNVLSQSTSDISIYSTSSALMTSEESTTGLSVGAEKLFQTLERLTTESETDIDDEMAAKETSDHENLGDSESEPASPASHSGITTELPRTSGSAINQHHQEYVKKFCITKGEEPSDLWQQTLPESTYSDLLGKYGRLEMQRQEVIWNFFEAELYYIRSLQTALKIFIHPLLTKERVWMSGVPTKLTRFFDWYDDIYQLHSKIYSTLHDLRRSQYPVVLHLSEGLRQFIPHLEIYQPYIARFNDVVELIKDLMEDRSSDFGEFLRIQSANEACRGIAFKVYLNLPIERLSTYQKTFRDLWLATTREHAEYVSSFSLYHSSKFVIDTMNEVVRRENDYLASKKLASHIEALPDPQYFANRNRRLLAHGPLEQILVHHMDQSTNNTKSPSSLIPGPSSAYTGRSYNYASISVDNELTEVNRKASHNKRSVEQPLKRERKRSIYAFVFTDTVLLTRPATVEDGDKQESSNAYKKSLRFMGLFRVLSVSEYQETLDSDHLLGLDILPMKPSQNSSMHIDLTAPLDRIFVRLPLRVTKSEVVQRQKIDRFLDWKLAYEQCCKSTLRLLVLPSSCQYSSVEVNDGVAADSFTGTLLASGLPLPKSPSQHSVDLMKGSTDDARQLEREERGWWTLQFNRVSKELAEQEFPHALLETTAETVVSNGLNTMPLKLHNITSALGIKTSSGGNNAQIRL